MQSSFFVINNKKHDANLPSLRLSTPPSISSAACYTNSKANSDDKIATSDTLKTVCDNPHNVFIEHLQDGNRFLMILGLREGGGEGE